MPHQSTGFAEVISVFACLFSRRVWAHVEVLLTGAVLTPGRRTVAAVLRVMGRGEERQFQAYHRVLSRDVWSGRCASRLLLKLLVQAFVPHGPLLLGLDDTLERRWGAKIAARGIYRDAVRSSRGHFVKASGLRWLSLMLLTPIPWAARVWALPFMTVLAPSERYHRERGLRHKRLTDWGRQMLLEVRRALPERPLVLVADSSFAALDFLAALSQRQAPIHVVTRLRLDAALYAPAPARRPHQRGRTPKTGARLATLREVLADPARRWQRVSVSNWYGEGAREVEVLSETALWAHSGQPVVPHRWVLIRDPHGHCRPQALLCTQQEACPVQVLEWFIQRWTVEVTFEEARAHLGVETQRQWSDKAIARTTPVLLALFSLVTLTAHHLQAQHRLSLRTSAWYAKERASFSDALAAVRRQLWAAGNFATSPHTTDSVNIPQPLLKQLTETLCYAA